MKILLIGAFERDNFGDCLFFVVTEKYLREVYGNDVVIVAASTIHSDMRYSFGHYVLPYKLCLEMYEWDLVWICGGQIGGCSMANALKFTLNNKLLLPQTVKSTRLITDNTKEWYAISDDKLGYVIDFSKYELNKDVQVVYNSVGGVNTMLRNNTILSRRDVKNGCPDIVHLLSTYYPKQYIQEHNYITFQCKADKFKGKMDIIVSQLVEIGTKHNVKIKLIAAGLASGHDSIKLYELLQDKINQKVPELCNISESRNVYDIVNDLMHSKLNIASSLHVRIVSASYNVPRISLIVDKVKKYALLWDKQYPINVDVKNLSTVSDNILSNHVIINNDLSSKVRNNLDNIISKLNVNCTNNKLDTYENVQKSILNYIIEKQNRMLSNNNVDILIDMINNNDEIFINKCGKL